MTFYYTSTKNVVKCLLHSHGNIDKIFDKNANNIFQIENSRNFKKDFFLKPILVNISSAASAVARTISLCLC